MKKFFLLALISVAVQLSINAQDIITKADGSRVEAKIEEITEEVIKYHRFDNLNGPIYTVPVTSVSSITFENGTVQAFNGAEVAQTSPDAQTAAMPNARDITQEGPISDMQLIKMSGKTDYISLRDKAKKFKWCAIIGGVGLLTGAFIVYQLSDVSNLAFYESSQEILFYTFFSGGVICGAAFGIASYLTYKKANKLEYESYSLFEGGIYESKNMRFSAGLNMLANHQVKNNAIGLGLKLTF